MLRALTELWAQLRVLPVPQPDGAATLWELTSARFTKQIKAGANAGQPTALSALISLYLGRRWWRRKRRLRRFFRRWRRGRGCAMWCMRCWAARQLETMVIDGKTLLHVAGELPAFAAAGGVGSEPRARGRAVAAGERGAGGSRITKFVAKPEEDRDGVCEGLAAKPAFGRSRERRPFGRSRLAVAEAEL